MAVSAISLELDHADYCVCTFAPHALQREWLVKDGKISFRQTEDKTMPEMPSKELIDNTLTYAREIERIV